jgi:hypothetical protein
MESRPWKNTLNDNFPFYPNYETACASVEPLAPLGTPEFSNLLASG